MTIAAGSSERGLLGTLGGLFRAVRPKQATKNGLILVALFFTINKWWNPDDVAGMFKLVGTSFGALALFCLLSGAIYIVNDLFDVERDQAHPRKRGRPFASGAVSIPMGWAAALVLAGTALPLSFLITTNFGYVALGYVGLTLAYNLKLKSIVIIDVMTVAAGYVIRAVAGSMAIDLFELGPPGDRAPLDLTMSPWLYICTALLALFITLAKRRGELIQAGDRSVRQRAILAEYSVPFLDHLIAIVAPATLVSYTLYTFSSGVVPDVNLPENNTMMFTIPFVAYGIFRYLYLIHQHAQGETPEDTLLTDKPLLVNAFLWLVASAAILLIARLS